MLQSLHLCSIVPTCCPSSWLPLNFPRVDHSHSFSGKEVTSHSHQSGRTSSIKQTISKQIKKFYHLLQMSNSPGFYSSISFVLCSILLLQNSPTQTSLSLLSLPSKIYTRICMTHLISSIGFLWF